MRCDGPEGGYRVVAAVSVVADADLAPEEGFRKRQKRTCQDTCIFQLSEISDS